MCWVKKALSSILVLIVFCASPVHGQTAQEIAQAALSSSVAIYGVKNESSLATGTGFFVGKNELVTCCHVIDGMRLVRVKLFSKDDTVPCWRNVRKDPLSDLALIRASIPDANILPLGDSDTVQIGDTVYTIGNPVFLAGTFSSGIVSKIWKRNEYPDMPYKIIQHTAPTSGGSSGGPLLNEHGCVIGVVFGGMKNGQNLNLAVPSNCLGLILPEHIFRARPLALQSTTQKESPILQTRSLPPSKTQKKESGYSGYERAAFLAAFFFSVFLVYLMVCQRDKLVLRRPFVRPDERLVKLRCPHCNQKVKGTAEKFRKPQTCPRCGQLGVFRKKAF